MVESRLVISMATKTKLKLKKKVKRFLLCAALTIVLIIGAIKLCGYAVYNRSVDGQLKDKGYELSTISLIKQKMGDEDIEYILNEDKIDYIKDLVGDKYFIKENFRDYLNYYQSNSKKTFKDVIAIVNVGADKSWYEDVKTTDTSDKYLMLVNKFNQLPENYDAGVIKNFSLTYAFGQVSAEETCYNAFIAMANAARLDNITLILTSGYRSYAEQKEIYDDMVASKGEQYALEYAAKPGTSEHETGLALDIFTYGAVMETFKTTETYAWLHEHAHEYGFIERYEEGKDYLTGYAPEAWHYRYVGIDTAVKLKEEGITYDEYYAFYLAK